MELFILLPLLIAIMAIIALAWYAFDAVLGGEDYATSKSTIGKVAAAIVAHHREKGVLYDLGSSRGGFLLEILEKCPELQAVGLDDSLIRTWTARLRTLVSNKRAAFVKKNIFDADISKADVVYAYLPRPILPALARKLREGLKPEAIVITSRVYFPDWQPSEILPKNPANNNEEDVFVYKFPTG